MTRIFINYRRDDTRWPAHKLYDRIKSALASPADEVVIDVDSIPLGVNYADFLDSKVAESDVLLAVIGPNWLTTRDPKTGERRIDQPEDFVRMEIASALRRKIKVIPVLMDGAGIPPADELPDDLKKLPMQNGVMINHLSFDTDVIQLMHGLGLKTEVDFSEEVPKSGWGIFPGVGLATLAALTGVLIWVFLLRAPGPGSKEVEPETAAGEDLIGPGAITTLDRIMILNSIHSWPLGEKLSSPAVQDVLSRIVSSPEISKVGVANTYYNYYDWGLSLNFLTPSEELRAVFFYSERQDGYAAYAGNLPAGLSFDMTRADVQAALGPPATSGGSEGFNAYDIYPGIGLQVNYLGENPEDMTAGIRHVVLSAPQGETR